MKRRRATASARGGAVAEINITPMVDVLLCLLILVMVIQPGLLKGVNVQVPAAETDGGPGSPATDQIILSVAAGPTYFINHEPVPAVQLTARISEIFRDRVRKVLFVKGAEDVTYQEVVAAVDLARGAGLRVIGLVPRQPSPKPERTEP